MDAPRTRVPEGEPKPVPSAEVMRTLRLHHASDVNALFYRWLIGQHEQTPLPSSNFEKQVLDALEALVRSDMGGANLVPRVPAVIPQLLKSLRDESTSALDLARQISHDIVLVAEVIHEATARFIARPNRFTILKTPSWCLAKTAWSGDSTRGVSAHHQYASRTLCAIGRAENLGAVRKMCRCLQDSGRTNAG